MRSGHCCSNGGHPACGRSPFGSPRWTMYRRHRCRAQERSGSPCESQPRGPSSRGMGVRRTGNRARRNCDHGHDRPQPMDCRGLSDDPHVSGGCSAWSGPLRDRAPRLMLTMLRSLPASAGFPPGHSEPCVAASRPLPIAATEPVWHALPATAEVLRRVDIAHFVDLITSRLGGRVWPRSLPRGTLRCIPPWSVGTPWRQRSGRGPDSLRNPNRLAEDPQRTGVISASDHLDIPFF